MLIAELANQHINIELFYFPLLKLRLSQVIAFDVVFFVLLMLWQVFLFQHDLLPFRCTIPPWRGRDSAARIFWPVEFPGQFKISFLCIVLILRRNCIPNPSQMAQLSMSLENCFISFNKRFTGLSCLSSHYLDGDDAFFISAGSPEFFSEVEWKRLCIFCQLI